MYARLLALICMLFVSVSTGRAQFLGSGDVAVYLRANAEHSTAALGEMKAELDTLMRSVGVNLHWWDRRKESGAYQELVVVELRGVCDAPHQLPPGRPLLNQSSLGSSAVADGQILPFSWVDCGALTRFIGPSVVDLPAPQRDFIYGRAMARLAAHELYHVLSRRSGHTQSGIGKAQFATADLLSDHLQFEETVVAGATGRRSHNVEMIAPGVALDMGNGK
jgi:hypothetical protein